MSKPLRINVFIVLFLLIIAIFSDRIYQSTHHLRDKTPYPATLIDVYRTEVNLGKSTNEIVFRGRFIHNDSKLQFDKNIDGFYYQRFIDGGKKPLAGIINVSLVDLGELEPNYVKFVYVTCVVSFVILLVYFLISLFFGLGLAIRKIEECQTR